MRSVKARKNHTHTHTHLLSALTVLPHLDPLPTARLSNTHLKRIDGSGTTGLYENRRNVKRYVHPCPCYNSTLFISHCITLHCTALHLSPFTSQSFILYCCSSTIPYCPCASRSLLLRVDDKTITFLSLHFRSFTLQHFTTPHTNRHSFKRRPLTDITNQQLDHHPKVTHKNSHQHAFSPRHRRSHHGAVRPSYFDSLACLCSSHLSCSSPGIFVLLDGDH
jgi:hypothetical protein